MLDFNITILIQLVNFLVVLVFLNSLLIRPIREIIQQRQSKVAGLLGDAQEFTESAEAKIKNYESALVEARKAATAERDMAKDAGLAKEAEIVAKATAEAQSKVAASREQIAADVAKAMDTLKGEVNALAEKATAKVLG